MSRESVKDQVKQFIIDAGANIGEIATIQAIRSQNRDWVAISADDFNLAIEDLIKDGEIERTSNGNIRRLK